MKHLSLSIICILTLCSLIACGNKNKNHMEGTVLLLETSMGDIRVRLYDDTPKHRDNIVKLAKEGFYDGTLFHRVIKDFMIQAGDPKSKNASDTATLGSGDTGYTLKAEILPGYFHKRGALAAAREGDDVNPEKNSSGSQFYIVEGKVFSSEELTALVDRINRNRQTKLVLSPEQMEAYTTIGGSPHLDGEYTVFGEVIEGMEVVKQISEQPTDENDRPLTDVVIQRMEVE